jgi:membrane protein DedA with SNARE-associated domain
MEFAEIIIRNFAAHFYIASYLAGFLGEEVVLFLAFLASQSMMHIRIIYILGPLGILTMDIVYFSLGKTGILRKLKEKISFLGRYTKMPARVVGFSEKHPLLTLTMTKFVYSMRIPMMIYHSARGMKYRKFIFFDFIALEVWAAVMIPLAWLAGRGLSRGLDIVKDFSKIVGIALIFIIVLYLINLAITHYIAKRKGNQLRTNSGETRGVSLEQTPDGQTNLPCL